MRKIETAEDILDFAIAREEDANQFYLALAERVETPEMRRVFEELADEELEHKATLELEFLKKGKTLFLKDRQVDFNISDYIINDEATLDITYKDMLSLAIEKEEAAFRTYINLLAYVDNQESREVLLALAEEEVRHKIRFEIEYNNLSKR